VWGTWAVGYTDNPKDAVHPHVCGEHAGVSVWDAGQGKVHPHVCGEHEALKLVGADKHRFIPTCVGNMTRFYLSV